VKRVLCAMVGVAVLGGGAVAASGQDGTLAPAPAFAPVQWHRSTAVGPPWHGRLRHGVQLPPQGPDFFTWDPVLERFPNRPWRRWGHDRLISTLLRVLHEYRVANLQPARVGIGDISRRRGGVFDERFGGLGHASHQNGLDVDVFYPRKDRLERRPFRAREIDTVLAQDLADRLVAAGAKYVFVGPRTRLGGRRGRVQVLAHHDDHMHVRLGRRRGGR
jgi:murein endopeptidase